MNDTNLGEASISTNEITRNEIYDPRPVEVRYTIESKRNIAKPNLALASVEAPRTLEAFLKSIPDWKDESIICVDGMSGCGKTTMLEKFNRKKLKVNLSNISKADFYNYKYYYPLDYVFFAPLTKAENVCWDRCKYSNLIFYLVHYLMAHYDHKGTDVPAPTKFDDVKMVCDNFFASNNMLDVIEYFEELQPTKCIYLVSSDIDVLKKSMSGRNELDRWNANNISYMRAQYHAMVYWARVLKMPVIDIAELPQVGLDLTALQGILKARMDIVKPIETRVEIPTNDVGHITSASNSYSHILLIDHSDK